MKISLQNNNSCWIVQKVTLLALFIGCIIFSAFAFAIYSLIDQAPQHYSLLVAGDPPVVTFYDIGVHQRTRLRRIEFFQESESNGRFELIWSLYPRTKDLSGESIQKLQYGQLPTGWTEVKPSLPISMRKNNRIVLETTTGTFNIELAGRNDWKVQGLSTRK